MDARHGAHSVTPTSCRRVDFLELGVDHAVVGAGCSASAVAVGAAGLGLVHGLAQLHRGLDQGLGLGGDRLGVLAFQRRLQVGQGRSRSRALSAAPTLSPCSARAFSVEWTSGVGLVAGLDQLLALLVLGLVGLGVLDHLLDVGVRQAAVGLDADRLLLVGRLVLGRTLTMPLASMSKVTSTCGTPRGAGGMPTRSNWPSILLSAAIGPLALEHPDGHRRLVVVGGREGLRCAWSGWWCCARSAG